MAKTDKTEDSKTADAATEEKEVKKTRKKADAEKPETSDKKAKLAKLLEKAKKLEGKVEEVKDVDLKKQVKPEDEEKKDTLVPMEDYLKASIHLGTRVITPDMRQYVYRRRADGLAVFNTALLDDKIRAGAAYLAQFAPEEIIIVCKREAGWHAVKKFAETTGIRAFTKKYPAGILTNTNLENFFECNLVFICDPWLDKNALQDANRIRIPALSICDTNNFTAGITQIIPGNNKSAKSLGIIFYLLTKIYVEARKLDKKVPPVQEFIDNWDTLLPPK
ncbi:30S ribosomal protein S2 [Candidatus Pacearchaeota archaeon]|nr:30S ribosomal protein S2 [Candidatus Pacearchaeota archaeon]